MTSPPWKGADWNGPTGRLIVRGRPARQDTGRVVPISFSFTSHNQLFPVTQSRCSGCQTPDSAKTQSERGLDSAEWSAEAEPEARASGKSDGKRSDRRETSGGAVPSAGWREVAEWCHAEGGVGHE